MKAVGISDVPIAVDFKYGASCRWRVPVCRDAVDGPRPPDELVVKTKDRTTRSRLRKALFQERHVFRLAASDPVKRYTVAREENGTFILIGAGNVPSPG